MKCIWKKRLCVFLVSSLIWQYGFMSYISYKHVNEVRAANFYTMSDGVKKFGLAFMLTILATIKLQNNTTDWYNNCSTGTWWHYYAFKLQNAVNTFTQQQWNLLQVAAANYLGNASYNIQNLNSDLGDQAAPIENTIAYNASKDESYKNDIPFVSSSSQYLTGYDLSHTSQIAQNSLMVDKKTYTILDITYKSKQVSINFLNYSGSYYVNPSNLSTDPTRFNCLETDITGEVGDTTHLAKFLVQSWATDMYTYTFSNADYAVMLNYLINSGNTALQTQLQNMTIDYGDYKTVVTTPCILSTMQTPRALFKDGVNVSLLNSVLGFSDGVNRWQDLGLVGDGSICYYPPVVKDNSKPVSVDSASTLVRQSTVPSDNSSTPLPTVSVGTQSIPLDGSLTGGGTTTGDYSGFWSTLWTWLQKILDAISSIPALLQQMWDWLKSLPGMITTPIINFFTIDWTQVAVATDYTPVFRAHFKPFYDITDMLTNIQGSPQGSDGKFYMVIPKAMGGNDQPMCVLDLTVGAVYISWARTILQMGMWIGFLWYLLKLFSPKIHIS